MSNEIGEKIKNVIEGLRPVFQRDRGDITFVSFDEQTGVVTVALDGMCANCNAADFTLDIIIKASLQETVPQVTAVVAQEAKN